MLLLKIISIVVLSIVVFVVVMSIGFAAGIMRGLKIMSIKGLKRTPFEDVVIKKVFTKDSNVDPFFYSLYLKEQRLKETDDFKEKLKTLQREIAEAKNPTQKLTKIKKKKRSGKK